MIILLDAFVAFRAIVPEFESWPCHLLAVCLRPSFIISVPQVHYLWVCQWAHSMPVPPSFSYRGRKFPFSESLIASVWMWVRSADQMRSRKYLDSDLDYVGREMGHGYSFLTGVGNGRGSMVWNQLLMASSFNRQPSWRGSFQIGAEAALTWSSIWSSSFLIV